MESRLTELDLAVTAIIGVRTVAVVSGQHLVAHPAILTGGGLTETSLRSCHQKADEVT